MTALEQRLDRAQTAHGEELWELVRDPHPQVIINAALNRNLSEEMAVFIAKKRSAPAEALGFLAGDVRFRDSHKLRLAICRNPRTPQRVTFSLLKFLRIFELGDLTRDQGVPITVRQKIELLLADKIPSMPSGVKTALARRSGINVVRQLMDKGDRNVISACLDSPLMTESLLGALINSPAVKPLVIAMIAVHPRWSLRYDIRLALVRNFHTPMEQVTFFISAMKTNDLRELYMLEGLPVSTKPYIYSELRQRGQSVEAAGDVVYVLPDEDGAETDIVEGD